MPTRKSPEAVGPTTEITSALQDAFQGHEAYGEKPPQRNSRARESRDGDVIHEEYEDVWTPTGLLDTTHIPARPGFVQRWIRTKLNGVDDPKNVMKRMNQGWRPRLADTVPQGVFAPTVNIRQFGDVIGMDGTVLMERPETQHAAHAAHNRAMTDRQMDAVNSMLAKEEESGLPIKKTMSSDVTTGRRAPVADE